MVQWFWFSEIRSIHWTSPVPSKSPLLILAPLRQLHPHDLRHHAGIVNGHTLARGLGGLGARIARVGNAAGATGREQEIVVHVAPAAVAVVVPKAAAKPKVRKKDDENA